jgi:hypothetical protein
MWTPVSLATINDVYFKIRKARPAWFEACPHLKPDDFPAFSAWVAASFTGWWENGRCVVFVGREGHVVTFHVAFLGPVDRDFLQMVAKETAAVRQEIPVTKPFGLVMRHLMRDIGFQCEGILRRKLVLHSPETGQDTYLDVEMWARLT